MEKGLNTRREQQQKNAKRKMQQTPNLNAGNTVSKQQPTSECRNVSWKSESHHRGNPNTGTELDKRRAIQDLLIC
jgi:hypothetical protein